MIDDILRNFNWIIYAVGGLLLTRNIIALNKKDKVIVQLQDEITETEKQLILLHDYVGKQELLMKDTYKMKHDFKHQLIYLRYLALHSRKDIILKNIDELLGYANKHKRNYVQSKNPVVDAIMNTKYEEAKAKGIKMEPHIFIPSHVPICDRDLCVIVGNAVDNALEAAEKTDNKIVEVLIGCRNNALYIMVKNFFAGELLIDKHGNYQTTKGNKNKHGFGLQSISTLVEKYNGEMVIDIEEDIFKLTIWLELMAIA